MRLKHEPASEPLQFAVLWLNGSHSRVSMSADLDDSRGAAAVGIGAVEGWEGGRERGREHVQNPAGGRGLEEASPTSARP